MSMLVSSVVSKFIRRLGDESSIRISRLSFVYGKISLLSSVSDRESDDWDSISSEIIRWANLREPYKTSRPGVEGSMLFRLRRRKLLIKPFFFEVLIEVRASVNLFYNLDWSHIPYKELLESFYIYNNDDFNWFCLIAYRTWTQWT
jgi:hypothetical protein